MDKTKIFFAYKHTDEPWGGANNFIRVLCEGMKKNPDFIVHHDANYPSDILFFSHLSSGPGNVSEGKEKRYHFSEIKRLKAQSRAKLVVRAVNLNINANGLNWRSIISYFKGGLFLDIETIFQSEFQKDFFKKWGYRGKKNTVIHNGAPKIFKNMDFSIGKIHNPIRLVSNSNFKPFKRHDIIAKMSLLNELKIVHVGKWSDKIKNHKVDVRGTLRHEEIVKIYKESDYLLHTAVADPCPNSIIEALNFGLPVIYNDSKGSSGELVRGNGIPIDKKNLKKTIELAKENFENLKKKINDDRDYYSIDRAIAMYSEVFNKFRK